MTVSAAEQHFIYLLNQTREDPTAAPAALGLDRPLSGSQPRGPLAPHATLAQIADQRSAEQWFGGLGPPDEPSTSANQRLRDAGYRLPDSWPADANYVETALAGSELDDAHAALRRFLEAPAEDADLVREQLLGQHTFTSRREIGVGHLATNATALADLWTVEIARQHNPAPLLTGVVFDDRNENGQYDPGEGLAGVTISVGPRHTQTNAAGGWSLPVTAGEHQVVAEGGLFAGPAAARVRVQEQNVALDFLSGRTQGIVSFNRWHNSLHGGDVTGDGRLTSADARATLSALVHSSQRSFDIFADEPADAPMPDVDGNRRMTTRDAVQVLRSLLSGETVPTVGSQATTLSASEPSSESEAGNARLGGLTNEFLVNSVIPRLQNSAPGTSVATNGSDHSVVTFAGSGPLDSSGVYARLFNSAGSPVGNAFLVNSTVLEPQQTPAIAMAANGDFLIAWQGRGPGDHSGIFGQWYAADGTRRGSETRINSTTGGVQESPAVAMAPDGGSVVVWSGVGSGDFEGIFLQRFDRHRQPLGGEVRVNTTLPPQQAFPSIAINHAGEFVVSWSSRHQDGSDWGIFAQRFAADGTPVGGEQQLNVEVAASQVHSSVGLDAAGNMVAVWQSYDTSEKNWNIYARRFDSAHRALSGETLVNTSTEGIQKEARLAMTPSGSYVITWTSGVPDGSGWEVFGRSYLPSGERSAEFQVNTVTSGPGSGHQQFSAVAVGAGPRAFIVWSGAGREDHAGVFADEMELGGDEPAPPVFLPIDDRTIPESQPFSMTVQARDPNGDDVRFAFVGSPPAGMTLDAETGLLEWTPVEAQGPGTYTITLRATDTSAEALSSTTTFQIVVEEVNRAPTLEAIDDLTVSAGQLIRLTAEASDPDIPANTLAFQFVGAVPAGATLNTSTGAFEWTPSAADAGQTIPITIRVRDDASPALSDDETFTITVASSSAPQITPVEDVTINELVQYSRRIEATDPDGDALRYELLGDPPAGIEIHPDSGDLTWTPNETQGPGEYLIEVQVTDSSSAALSSTISFTITVLEVNRAPQLGALADREVMAGSLLEFNVSATDLDFPLNTLSYALIGDVPTGATIDSASGLFRWRTAFADADQSYPITVRVTDNGNPALSDEETFIVSVTPCEFHEDPEGWSVTESGGSATGKGAVTIDTDQAVLREGDSFEVTLERELVLPAGPARVEFSIISASFDTSTTGAIRDAFEVALLADNGQSIVYTFAPNTDAYFNLTEGLPAALGATAQFDGQTVSLDVPHIGNSARLVFRLVNNDGDTETTVALTCVQVVPDETPAPLLAGPRLTAFSLGSGEGPVGPQQTSSPANADASSVSNTPLTLPLAIPSLPYVPPGTATSSQPSSGAAEPEALYLALQALAGDAVFTNRGTDFWLGFADNLPEQGAIEMSLFITGDIATTGTVSIPGLGFTEDFVVNPGQVTTVALPPETEAQDVAQIQAKGVHVVAEDPVTVYGLNRAPFTTDAFLGFPTAALGTEYLNMTYKNTGRLLAFIAGTQLLVVGAHDDTQVTIAPGPLSPTLSNSNVTITRPGGSNYFQIGNGVDSATFLTDEAGNYTLTIAPPLPAHAGNYRFQLLDLGTTSTPVTYGESITGTLPLGTETRVYRFDGQRGDALYLDALGLGAQSTVMQVISPSNALIASVNADQDTTLTLAETGTHYVVVSARAGAPVTYGFRLLDLAGVDALPFDTPMTGNFPIGREAAVFHFQATAGQVLLFDSLTDQTTSTVRIGRVGADPLLVRNAVEDFAPITIGETGTYYLYMQGNVNSATSYGFQLLDITQPTALSLDTELTGTFASGREGRAWLLNGVEGKSVLVDALDADFDQVRMVVLNSAGQAIYDRNADSDFYPLTFNGTGPYRLLLLNQTGAAVDYRLRLIDVSAAPVLTAGLPVSGSLASQETKAFRISTAALARLLYDGIDNDFDNVTADLFNPAGASYFRINADSDSNVISTLVGGTQYLFLSNNSSATTDFAFNLHDVGDASLLTLGTDTQGTLPTGRETAFYRFQGTRGQRVFLDSLDSDGDAVSILLRSPENAQVFFVSANSDSTPVILPESGAFTLQVIGGANNPADYRFRLLDVADATELLFTGPQSVTLNPARTTALYTFSAGPGEQLHFDSVATTPAPGSSSWTLYGPDQAVLHSTNLGNDFSVNPLTSGVYILAISGALDSGSLDFDFEATRTPHAPVAPSGFGSEQLLTIAAGEEATYTFTAPAGRLIYVENIDTQPDNVNTQLIAPSGQILTNTSDQVEIGTKLLPEPGTYTIKVRGFNATQTGNYRFRVIDLTGAAAPLALGAEVNDTFDKPFDTQAYKIGGAAFATWYYDAIDADSDNVAVELITPAGVRLALDNADNDRLYKLLPQSGDYFLLLHNNLNATPDYRLRMLDASAAAPIALGTTISGDLNAGRHTQLFTFDASAGQRLFYDGLDNDNDNVAVQLLSPEGTELFLNNADADVGPFTVSETGTYTVVIRGQLNTPANFSFRILDVATPAALTLGAAITGTVGPTGRETDVFSFAGTAGQRLAFDALDGDFDPIAIRVLDPLGQVLLEVNTDNENFAPLRLPHTGNYTVYVQGGMNSEGDYRFRFLDLSAAPLLSFDSVVQENLADGMQLTIYRVEGAVNQALYYNGLDNDQDQVRVELYDPWFNTVVNRNADDDFPFRLTSTLPYYVVIRGQVNGASDFRFVVQDSAAPPTITLGQDVSGTLNPGTTHVTYQFDASAGQHIYYDALDSDNDNVSMVLYTPSGAIVRSSNADSDSGIFALDETGAYRLVIAGGVNTPTDYRFRVLDADAAPVITFGNEIEETFAPRSSANLYRLDVLPGQILTLDSTFASGPAGGSWSIVDAASRNQVTQNLTSDFTRTIFSAGTHYLVNRGDTDPGTFTRRFIVTAAAPAAVPLNGFGVVEDLTVNIDETVTRTYSAPIGRILYLDVQRSSFSIPVHTVELDQGETYLIRNEGGFGVDLTGTVITSDKPVAAFGSHLCSFIPDGRGFCDHLVEQLPPTSSWGREFVTMPLATRTNGDTFRFLAATDGTTVQVNGSVVATLNRGEFHERILTTPSEISSNHPILVAQFSNGSEFDGTATDPFMLIVPPYEQFLSNYTITTPASGFPTNYVNILAPEAAVGSIDLDGVPIAADQFVRIGSSDFFGAQVLVDVGSHQLAGPQPFGLFVYGYFQDDSYGYTGGQSLSPVARASELLLSPAETQLPVSSTVTLSARVLDDLGEPLEGVRVDFDVSGTNSQTGFAFTDEEGIARFTYVSSVEGIDSVEARVSSLTAQAVVRWTAPAGPPTIEILSPLNLLEVPAGSLLTISGRAIADRPAAAITHVMANGIPVEVLDGAGNFFTQILVGLGENRFEFTAFDSLDQSATTTITLTGVATDGGDVDFRSLSDVTGSFQVHYARTSLNAQQQTLLSDIAITNSGGYSARAPLYVGIANISDPEVTVLGADGFTPDGVPYYDFTELVPGERLDPEEQTGFLSAAFFTPNGQQFTYDLVFYGQLNRSPAITSIPRVQTVVGTPYEYDATAQDPDGDALTFTLLSGPEGATLDPDSGTLRWTPSPEDRGVHDIFIEVTDGQGGRAEQRFALRVSDPVPNRPPLFASLPITTAGISQLYQYDADALDPDGDALTFTIVNAPAGMTIDESSGLVSWTPATNQLGDQPVVLRVADPAGLAVEQAFTICVEPAAGNHGPLFVAPTATFVNLPTGTTSASYEAQLLALDADGDALQYALLQGPEGLTLNTATGAILWEVDTGDIGPHVVRARVSDGKGAEDLIEFTVTVLNNNAPQFTSAPLLSASIGAPYVYQVASQDADGDTVSYRLSVAPPGMQIDAAGKVTWLPPSGSAAEQPVVILAEDGKGGLAEQSFSIQVNGGLNIGNRAPQFLSTPPDQATVGAALRYTPALIDFDGDQVQFSLALAPSGMALDRTTGTLVWSPAAEQAGTHTVVIRAADMRGAFSLQTFTINVAPLNTAPVVTSAAEIAAVANVPLRYHLTAQDAESQALTFALVAPPAGVTLTAVATDPGLAHLDWTPPQAGSFDLEIVVSDAQGAETRFPLVINVAASATNAQPQFISNPGTRVTLGRDYFYQPTVLDPDLNPHQFTLLEAPAGMTRDVDTGFISWRPAAADVGVHHVELEVADGRGGSAVQAWDITVITSEQNRAPSIVSLPPRSALADDEFRYDLAAVDPDQDVLQWSLEAAPAGASIDPVRGTLRWTPSHAQLGTHTFTVAVVDPQQASARQTFSVFVSCVDLPPVITSQPIIEAGTEVRYVYAVRALDPEGGPLAFALEDAPSGMTIEPSSGVIRWTPAASQAGTAEVLVRATDSQGHSTSQAFTIQVTAVQPNQAPIITSRPAFRATVDEPYSYLVEAFDPEGGAVGYRILQAPSGVTLNESSGLLQWTPTPAQAGGHVVIVAAEDDQGLQGVQRFSILARVNQAPVIDSEAPDSVDAGSLFRYDVSATDPDDDALAFALEAAPAGMTIDGLGRIRWQTSLSDVADHTFEIVVTDVHGLSARQSVTLTVTPDETPPAIALTASSLRVPVGSTVVLHLSASDNVAVASLQLTLNGQPVTLDASGTATVTLEAIGTFTAVATATDSSGNTATTALQLRAFDPADTEGPTVIVTAPAPNSIITTLTDVVGTITDPNLQFYRLQVARADLVDVDAPEVEDPDFKTIFEGTSSVTSDVLGTFDPTLLTNDNYVLRVVAEDTSGNATAITLPLSVEGALKLGQFTFSVTDLTVPLAGIPITITRTYDTLEAGNSGDLGFGWRLDVQEPRIRETIPVDPLEEQGLFFAANPYRAGTRVYLNNPDGRRVGFTFDPIPQFSFFGGTYWLPRFRPDPGVYDTLEVDETALQRRPDGTFGIHFLGFNYNPSLFKLTTKAGLTYHYNQFTGLESIQDRFGNVVTFEDTAITSSTGEQVQLVRDPLHRIVQILDPEGKPITYDYDAQGDLVAVTTRAGLTTTYAYLSDPAHYLEAIVDPSGRTTAAMEYDGDGRIRASTNAAGNAISNVFDLTTLTEVLTDSFGKETITRFDARGNITSVTDPLGHTTTVEYDANDNVTLARDAAGNEVTRTFDARGNLTSMTDPLGQTYHMTYSPFDEITSVTDPLGRTTTLIYDGRGALIQQINALGESSSMAYDALGRLVSQTDRAGNTIEYKYGQGRKPIEVIYPPVVIAEGSGEAVAVLHAFYDYDADGQVTRAVDEKGHETQYFYDADGRPLLERNPLGQETRYVYEGEQLVAIVDALQRETRYEYDDIGRQTRVIDPAGGIVERTYDANNRVTAISDPTGRLTRFEYRDDNRIEAVIDPHGHRTTYEYDENGNVLVMRDARGNECHYTYDALGRVTSKTDQLGQTWTYEYDVVGNYVSTTDPLGFETRYEYDALNRLTRTIDALGGAEARAYDTAGRLSTVVAPNGAISRYEYDARGLVLKVVNPDLTPRRFEYDGAGNLVAFIDELDQRTVYAYDDANRLATIIDPNSGVRMYERNDVGNVIAIIDPLGQRTEFRHDQADRTIEVKNPAGDIIRYEYDSAGRRTKITDPLNQSTQFSYDEAGRLENVTDPTGQETRYAYDEVGNLVEIIDRNDRVRAFTYDKANQLIQENWLEGGSSVWAITSAYDARGQLLSISDPASTLAFTYDALGRLTTEDNQGTPGVPHFVLEQSYDAVGNPLTIGDNFGVEVERTYNVRDFVESLRWNGIPAPLSVEFDYDARGSRTDVRRYADGVFGQLALRTESDFDGLGRLTQLTHFDATDSALADYDYGYDLASQLIEAVENGQTTQYDYDPTGQLVATDRTAGADEEYTYDANGNRIGDTWTVGANNRILADDRYDYAYDGEGNLIQRAERATGIVTQLSYDFRNRLVGIERRDTSNAVVDEIHYVYDAFDRRILQEVNGTVTATVYAGSSTWADFDADGNVLARYLAGPQVDELLARYRPGEGASWYLADRLGSVRDITDLSGTLVDHLEYDSFGNVLSETNAAAGDRFKFTGREWDEVAELYYYRARYYAPDLGRFISEDPLRFGAGDTNLQRYVGNAPTNATDPSGLQAVNEWSAVGDFSSTVTSVALGLGADTPFTFRVQCTPGNCGIQGESGPISLSAKTNIKLPLKGFSVSGGLGTGGPDLGLGVKADSWGFAKGTFGIIGQGKFAPKPSIGNPPVGYPPLSPPGKPLPEEPSGPSPRGDFSFLVESTAKTPHLIISFNLAIFTAVATELALIAEVAVAPDTATLAEVALAGSSDSPKASFKSRGFANLTPNRAGSGSTSRPPVLHEPPPPKPPEPGGGGGGDGGGGAGGGDGGGGGGCGPGGGFFGCMTMETSRNYLQMPYLDGSLYRYNPWIYDCCATYLDRYYFQYDASRCAPGELR